MDDGRLWLSLFISSIEVTIVSTALFKISDDLNALTQSHWIIVAYMFTYNGTTILHSTNSLSSMSFLHVEWLEILSD